MSVLTRLLLVLCILQACNQDKKSTHIPPVTVEIDDSWLMAIGDSTRYRGAGLKSLMAHDLTLSRLITTAILEVNDTTIKNVAVESYLSDTFRIRLKDSATNVFRHWDWQQTLGEPFAAYTLSFPEKQTPILYPVITDFNYGLFLFQNDQGRDALGVGFEMFLGTYALYDQLSINNPNFSTYINRTFNLAHLPSKILYALAADVVLPPANNRLLDHILTEGKKTYLVQAWLPTIADTLLYEFTQDQLDWVRANELDIWRYLLTDRLLYKVSGRDIANLTQPAPHSQGMPPEAPGRAANYIGHRIIKAFMKSSAISHQELAKWTDFDRILTEAKYRP